MYKERGWEPLTGNEQLPRSHGTKKTLFSHIQGTHGQPPTGTLRAYNGGSVQRNEAATMPPYVSSQFNKDTITVDIKVNIATVTQLLRKSHWNESGNVLIRFGQWWPCPFCKDDGLISMDWLSLKCCGWIWGGDMTERAASGRPTEEWLRQTPHTCRGIHDSGPGDDTRESNCPLMLFWRLTHWLSWIVPPLNSLYSSSSALSLPHSTQIRFIVTSPIRIRCAHAH